MGTGLNHFAFLNRAPFKAAGGFLFLLGALILPNPLQSARANGDTRALNMYHNHTGEQINIVYKRDGRYDLGALKQLDWFLRDWRKNEAIQMDPRLLDLVWEVNRDLNAKAPVHIICGYRSEGTNNMLHSRSRGVALHSQHTLGRAMDVAIPGVATERLREMGMVKQKGGVGFYPTSGTPFVHLDVGSVRAWPRMTTDQLARLFPSGQTLHLPSDGPPLDGYNIALARLGRDGKRNESAPLLAYNEENTGPGEVLRSAETLGASMTVASLAPVKPEPPKISSVAIPMPMPRPASLAQMAMLVPEPQMRPVILTASNLPAPKIELTPLHYDARATAGFFRPVAAERSGSLTAPQMKLAASYLEAPVTKTIASRKWIRVSGLRGAQVKLAQN
jgi:uncharacterized protein YcbK (DUF882 family)